MYSAADQRHPRRPVGNDAQDGGPVCDTKTRAEGRTAVVVRSPATTDHSSAEHRLRVVSTGRSRRSPIAENTTDGHSTSLRRRLGQVLFGGTSVVAGGAAPRRR